MDAAVSAEQEDVAAIRWALEELRPLDIKQRHTQALAALDRLAAALERAEQKYDNAQSYFNERESFWFARAEKAERALAEMREALEASDALIRFLRPDLSHTRSRADEVVARNRAALRPEDTSDEN